RLRERSVHRRAQNKQSNRDQPAHSFGLANNFDWLVMIIFTLPTILPMRVTVSNSTESPAMLKSERLMKVRSFELRTRVFKFKSDSLNSMVRLGWFSGV